MRKPRKPLSQEDYQALVDFCHEERTIEQIAEVLNGAHSTAYICTRYLCGKYKLRKIRYKGNKRVYFKSVDNPELFKKQCQEDELLKKQQMKRDYDNEVATKKVYSIKNKGVVDKSEIGHTVVNGMNGYHPYREKRVSPKVYVSGSTLNGI